MSWQIKTASAVIAVLLAFCLWQQARINGLKADLAGIETALAKAHADAVKAALDATTHIISTRDTAYAGVHDARTEAAKTIAGLPEDRGDAALFENRAGAALFEDRAGADVREDRNGAAARPGRRGSEAVGYPPRVV